MSDGDPARTVDATSSRERRLVAKIRAGDHRAFSQLFNSLHDGLFTFAASLTGDRDTARDLVQGVFVSLWENRAAWKPATTSRAYLYRAVRNRAINVTRRAHTTALDEDTPNPDRSAIDDASYRALLNDYRRAIDALPERRQLVYRLCRIYGLSYDEAATVLGISINTVRTQMSVALADIRRALAHHLE